MSKTAVILADGSFPEHEIPLGLLRNADHIICCDGSTENLIKAGMTPEAVVGDLDSLGKELAERFSDRLFKDESQETNDLTKAVSWCIKRGFRKIIILGATGKREDHTIGNISLLAEFSREINVTIVTDTGTLIPLYESSEIASFPGQQVSVFSLDPEAEISSKGLKYELQRLKLHSWWRATLNEATGSSFGLLFEGGPLIIYQKFMDNQSE
jgi:thiamine pyrophosphokinase